MSVLVPLPVVVPLGAAALSLLLFRWRNAQRVVSLLGVATALAASVALLIFVGRDGIQVTEIGGWEAPFGIALVADEFATIMLTVATIAVLAVLIYSLGHEGHDRVGGYFHPAYLALTAGVTGAFLTGDLFNLFVFFEIMLTASYVLITIRGGREQVRHGMTYVVISLVSSALFVLGLAFIYTELGTVNMADLAVRIDEIPGEVRTALGLFFLVVFGIKAAIFPLFFWLPDSYPTAPTPVTAIFAGLLTKVGVYAIIRTQTLIFHTGDTSNLLLIVAGLTMVVGVIGAIAQNDVKRILSFHIVSQIGYMIFGLALFTLAGLAGAILYTVHHILVKTSMFLVGGLIEVKAGTAALSKLGGLLRKAPWLAVLFLLPALSLAGLPPFSGFVAKLSLIEAGFGSTAYTITAISLAVSVLTLFSMTKIWAGVFWGKPATVTAGDIRPSYTTKHGSVPVMIFATVSLVIITLAVAVGAESIYELAQSAANSLLDKTGYIKAVLG